MADNAKTWLQTCLKILNSIIGIVGITMILYSFWMVRIWQRDMDGSSFNKVIPWFICTFLGIGITLCVITCLGHVSAHTANGFCLSCYTLIIFLLLLLETAVAADIFLNSDWEKDLPEDQTGRFDDFKDFVKSNFDICKWIGLLVALAQGLIILTAMILRTLGTNKGSFYESDDYATGRVPFLNHPIHPPPYMVGVADPHFASTNDAWNIRVHDNVKNLFKIHTPPQKPLLLYQRLSIRS